MTELPDELHIYFSAHLNKEGDWANRCLAVVDCWQSLKAQRGVTSQELAHFVQQLDTIKNLGTAAYELFLWGNRWARDVSTVAPRR